MSGTDRIACFGEMLLRLAAEPGQMLCTAQGLRLFVGGAEANVAIALAHLGHPSAMITVLADNPLGTLCAGELRRHGVDTAGVRTGAGRMGLYFLERGAGSRPARVVYDRESSAFCRAMAEPLPWERLLDGCTRLHVSGITAALSGAAADALIAGVRAARARRLGVSFDCNYRPSLWQARAAQAGAVLRGIAEHVDTLFANGHDLAMMLGDGPPHPADEEAFTRGARAALACFAQLRRVATTFRLEPGADDQALAAVCVSRDGVFRSRTHALRGVVERIGSGDAFAAGMLHGELAGLDAQRAVEFAVACACLKHSVATDFSSATAGEVEALVRGETAMRR